MQIPVTDPGSWPNYPARDANAGHGHIYRRPDGVVVHCGGPRYCVACTADELEAASAWCDAVAAGEGSAEEARAARAMLASAGATLRDQRDSAIGAIAGAAALREASRTVGGSRGVFRPMPMG